MSLVSVTFDGERLSEAEDENDGGVWDDWGKSTSPTQEIDVFYQNTACISNKISAATGGVEFLSTGTNDYEGLNLVVIAVVNVSTYALIDTSIPKGAAYQVGSSDTVYFDYNIFGSVAGDYPASGGFQFLAIDPNIPGYRDDTVGTPDLTAIDYYGWFADIPAGGVKADNVMHDTLSFITSGTGLTLTGGINNDDDGYFLNFVNADEGTFDTGRWGIVRTGASEIIALGFLTIGNATATEFTDSLRTIVFPDARVAPGFFGIGVGLQNGSTVVNITNCVFVSNGNENVTDTRARFDVTGTTGNMTVDTCNFINFAGLTGRSSSTFTGCNIVESEAFDAYGATVTNCIFFEPPTSLGQAHVFTDDPELFTGCEWVSGGLGHAIRCDTVDTFGWVSNTDSGYTGARGTNLVSDSGSENAMFFNNSGGLITLNVSGTGGLQPSVRNGSGATTVVTSSVSLEVNGVTEGTRVVLIGADGSELGNILLEAYANASGVVSGSFGGSTPQLVSIRARNSGIINAAVLHDDDGADTDFTNAARESAGSDDVTLLPAVPAANDAFYYGGIAKFAELLINITTAGDTFVLAWEYWNGAWVSLTVVDGTNAYSALGWNTVTFTAPSDWVTTSFNGQGPYFYVRARVTTGGGTQPFAENITLNETEKYLPFNGIGTIAASTGLTTTAVWIQDPNNP